MSEKEFVMRLHGDFAHRLAIYILKDILAYKGVKFRDERQFKNLYHSPCEPDLYFECEDIWHDGNKKVKRKVLRVIEVETNPTKESVAKKQQQYTEALAGVQLTVIDISKALVDDDWEDYSLESILQEYRAKLELELPV